MLYKSGSLALGLSSCLPGLAGLEPCRPTVLFVLFVVLGCVEASLYIYILRER